MPALQTYIIEPIWEQFCALFPLGRLAATPRAFAHLARSRENSVALLGRHQSGDWGEIPPEDVKNDISV